jgi:GPH family glycoside/pentoside/hexuronide:cation symporter
MGVIPAVLIVLGLVVMRRWPEKGLHLHRLPQQP